jgi:hypothetical protein
MSTDTEAKGQQATSNGEQKLAEQKQRTNGVTAGTLGTGTSAAPS